MATPTYKLDWYRSEVNRDGRMHGRRVSKSGFNRAARRASKHEIRNLDLDADDADLAFDPDALDALVGGCPDWMA